MTDVELPSGLGDRRLDRLAEDAVERVRDLEDRHRLPRPDVDRQEVRARRLDHEDEAGDDVVNRHEVAQLSAVLEHHGLAIVQQTTQPDGGNARVRIAQALPRTVDVEEARRDRRECRRSCR